MAGKSSWSESLLLTIPSEIRTSIWTFLPSHSLTKVIRVCDVLYEEAIRILYMRDAFEDGSSAILRAVHTDDSGDSFKAGRHTICLSLAFGGDINAVQQCDLPYPEQFESTTYAAGSKCSATALHLAAGLGKHRYAAFLLEKGADASSRACYPWLCDNRLPTFATLFPRPGPALYLQRCLLNADVLPLALPLLMGDVDMVRLLLSKGAPVDLVVNRPQSALQLLSGTQGLTIFHVLAVRDPANLARWAVESFRREINRQLPHGISPLHLSVISFNKPMVDLLLSAGADCNTRSRLGGTPLCTAIEACVQSTDKPSRTAAFGIMRSLIEAGVDVYMVDGRGRTPLFVAVDSLPAEIWFAGKETSEVVNLLLSSKEVDIQRLLNTPDSNGHTVAHLIVNNLDGSNLKPRLAQKKVFLDLCEKGLDLNLPYADGSSIIMHVMESHDMTYTPLIALLASHGAMFLPHEAGEAFELWFTDSSFRRSAGFDPSQYAAHITQTSVDEKFDEIFKQAKLDTKLFKQLFKVSQHFSRVHERLSDALQAGDLLKFEMLQRFSYDPNWGVVEFGGYVHQIIKVLIVGYLSEKQAMTAIEVLIGKGASLAFVDPLGNDIFEVFRQSDTPPKRSKGHYDFKWSELRLRLYEAREAERGIKE